ncbi:hypothetical protein [Actinoplanes xinjiangensis]|nr:hypothetical protein [Actinoplanes xinjiangensis]
MLVSVAAKVWKAKRVEDLEQLSTERIAAASGVAFQNAFAV